ncbi:hypothetical protein VHEMI07333 [[Torrubiella] hemipterigena]|uniref:Uncharacterized protein n=1 Tax=[Torrubiella] hemipterigena TaxID=1531966 RepID=A0A0A1TMR6_9HYPO|nr:hypothetical protein VHEMI07333 [[Torrubiella] hemipterigena]
MYSREDGRDDRKEEARKLSQRMRASAVQKHWSSTMMIAKTFSKGRQPSTLSLIPIDPRSIQPRTEVIDQSRRTKLEQDVVPVVKTVDVNKVFKEINKHV